LVRSATRRRKRGRRNILLLGYSNVGLKGDSLILGLTLKEKPFKYTHLYLRHTAMFPNQFGPSLKITNSK